MRSELGPEAVVISVKQIPQGALGWLSGKSKLEVTACIPDKEVGPPSSTIAGMLLSRAQEDMPASDAATTDSSSRISPLPTTPKTNRSSCRKVLETMGLLPRYTEIVLESARKLQRAPGCLTLARELAIVRGVLIQHWRKPPDAPSLGQSHVFVGPPGSGKTTVLCKWLAQTVLVEGRTPRAWRLDGASANQAESLSVYCEILGVPLLRSWTSVPESTETSSSFIDLPGAGFSDAEALKATANQIAGFRGGQVHLVLNAAYTTSLLMSQLRAFAQIVPVSDIIFTHLDEERSWGKLWNFVLGTDLAIHSLSAGQNIPGYFQRATSEHLLPAWFPK